VHGIASCGNALRLLLAVPKGEMLHIVSLQPHLGTISLSGMSGSRAEADGADARLRTLERLNCGDEARSPDREMLGVVRGMMPWILK